MSQLVPERHQETCILYRARSASEADNRALHAKLHVKAVQWPRHPDGPEVVRIWYLHTQAAPRIFSIRLALLLLRCLGSVLLSNMSALCSIESAM